MASGSKKSLVVCDWNEIIACQIHLLFEIMLSKCIKEYNENIIWRKISTEYGSNDSNSWDCLFCRHNRIKYLPKGKLLSATSTRFATECAILRNSCVTNEDNEPFKFAICQMLHEKTMKAIHNYHLDKCILSRKNTFTDRRKYLPHRFQNMVRHGAIRRRARLQRCGFVCNV